ncbi:MAG: argininosuccinate lyase [Gammaproteobacteria bacterium]|nr:MAG: argininosuccinate lyase [Gammaproteobacteria bacterium]
MQNVSKKNKSWGAVMSSDTDDFVKTFGASVTFDKKLYSYDIQGSIAHATMLCKCKIINNKELKLIKNGLEQIHHQIQKGQFQWSIDAEDVHMNIEKALIDEIGEAGKKLHTARSRNDQIATDIRLYLREATEQIKHHLILLSTAILDQATVHTDTIMPGFTHLQAAQPITVGFHLMAWHQMIYRDLQRLQDCHQRINIMPLGSAALAGTSYPIDRNITQKLLKFDSISENALDAVSDRDFAIEFTSFASILMMHLSRMSEEIILWSSAQFNFITMPDEYSTGSSIMPQKKNPDVPELVRGKTSRIYGHLMSLLSLMKSQPLAYNKDIQEDKEPLFDTVDTILNSTKVFTGMITKIRFNKDILLRQTKKGYTTATDLADYLTKKDIAFRDAHHIVGAVVAYAMKQNINLEQLTLGQLQNFHPQIEQDVFDVLNPEMSLNLKNSTGGSAPHQTKKSIKQAYKNLENLKN